VRLHGSTNGTSGNSIKLVPLPSPCDAATPAPGAPVLARRSLPYLHTPSATADEAARDKARAARRRQIFSSNGRVVRGSGGLIWMQTVVGLTDGGGVLRSGAEAAVLSTGGLRGGGPGSGSASRGLPGWQPLAWRWWSADHSWLVYLDPSSSPRCESRRHSCR
jgi:hypothetical protein